MQRRLLAFAHPLHLSPLPPPRHTLYEPQEDDDEYELDIDALDAETCWKLQAYVDSVLAAEAARLPGQAPPPAGAPAAAVGGAGAAAPSAPQPAAAAAAIDDSARQAAGGGAQPVADGAPARSSGERLGWAEPGLGS